MRFARATVRYASALGLGALVAGCSVSSQGNVAPAAASPAAAHTQGVRPGTLPHDPVELLREQAYGNLAAPVPRAQVRAQLDRVQAGQSHT